MSLIFEALKKLERERDVTERGFQVIAPAPWPARSRAARLALVSLAAGFLVSVINARVLGPAGSGLVAYAMWVVVCVAALADRGFPQMVLRYVAAARDKGEDAWAPIARRAFSALLPSVALAFVVMLAFGIYHRLSGAPAPWK